MKAIVALMIILSLVAATQVSLLVMSTDEHGVTHDHGCAAALASGTDCPLMPSGELAVLGFHVDFLERFVGTIVNGVAPLILIGLVLILFADRFRQIYLLFQQGIWSQILTIPLPLFSQWYAWLALHETSPTA